MSAQFVDGWTIVEVLGEGAFGEVKLLVHNETHEAVAVKILNTGSDAKRIFDVKKEVATHKHLDHPNIVRYFGYRSEPGIHYIFLEYAAGGELFDRIEPDVGMASGEARTFFLQLVSAVVYLHDKGCAHRDIKPENILLTDQDQVKLSDFGMATMFRKNGVERLVENKCGTMPYVAPEVMLRPYNAAPADVWSCGVVLVAMLAGELPWNEPKADNAEFAAWRDGSLTMSPWCRFDTEVLSLLRKLLSPLPNRRPAAEDIPKMRWCRSKSLHDPVRTLPTTPAPKRISLDKSDSYETPVRLCLTQPLPRPKQDSLDEDETDEANKQEPSHFCFSQPVALDDLLLSSQLHASQAASTPTYQRLVRRMTRLLVSLSPEQANARLTTVLESLSCGVRCSPPSMLTASLTDCRNNQLTFKVNTLLMDGSVLLDFRLSRGDGLEFKKLFIKIKTLMADVVIKKNVPWPMPNEGIIL